jgi:hypothetical protein
MRNRPREHLREGPRLRGSDLRERNGRGIGLDCTSRQILADDALIRVRRPALLAGGFLDMHNRVTRVPGYDGIEDT